jgi:plasmid replication initiation protein
MAKNLLVVKSNSLVEASYRLTPSEQGIILSCVAQIKKGDAVTDQVTYKISVRDYARLTGANLNAAYRDVRQSVLRLLDRKVRITREPNGVGKCKKVLLTRWVQDIEYSDQDSTVELRFSHSMLPYLANLTKCFTKYRLSSAVKMKSSYGFRLYELLIQWEDRGVRQISLADFRGYLMLEKKYPAYRDFKKRVLDFAVNDINLNSSLQVKYQQIKTGRKITDLVFIFNLKGCPDEPEKANLGPSKINYNHQPTKEEKGVPMPSEVKEMMVGITKKMTLS